MKKLSIGTRLTVWYLLIFAAAQVVFGIGMWMLLRYHLYDIADDDLETQVQDLSSFLQAQPADASFQNLQQALTAVYSREHAGDYMQVYVGSGQWLFRSDFFVKHALPLPEPGAVKRPWNQDRTYDGLPLRFTTAKLNIHGRLYVVQTGFVIDDVVGTLAAFRRLLVLFAPALFLLAAVGGYWLSRRALAPVDAIVTSAREISGVNLHSRLEPLHTGDELQRLVDTLNEMLQRIEQSFQRITQFTADASHELRTPISLVRTEAELALRKSRAPQEYREALEHILFEAERTTVLIEELLSLARADAGREILEMHALDLSSMLQGVATQWKPLAAIRDVQFQTNLAAAEAVVLGDETALRRVVNILLENAFKFTSAGGSVELTLAREHGDVSIVVRDTGIGIPKEEHTKIFARFYRIDKARSREANGAGLGLSIAQWIIEQHRGSIAVESELGRGAIFRVRLPHSSIVPGSGLATPASRITTPQ